MRPLYGLFVLVFPLSSHVAGQEVEPEDLKPGLVATFRDSGGTEVFRLEPTIALNLAPGESPTPVYRPRAALIAGRATSRSSSAATIASAPCFAAR